MDKNLKQTQRWDLHQWGHDWRTPTLKRSSGSLRWPSRGLTSPPSDKMWTVYTRWGSWLSVALWDGPRRTQWCHRLRLEVVKWDRAAIDVQQRTDSCCPPERQRDTFWTAAWCINSVFSTNVKLSTLCASLLMEHHVLSPTYRPLVSVFLYFFLFVFLFYFLFEPPSGEEASLPSLPYCHPAFGLTIFWLFILILGK